MFIELTNLWWIVLTFLIATQGFAMAIILIINKKWVRGSLHLGIMYLMFSFLILSGLTRLMIHPNIVWLIDTITDLIGTAIFPVFLLFIFSQTTLKESFLKKSAYVLIAISILVWLLFFYLKSALNSKTYLSLYLTYLSVVYLVCLYFIVAKRKNRKALYKEQLIFPYGNLIQMIIGSLILLALHFIAQSNWGNKIFLIIDLVLSLCFIYYFGYLHLFYVLKQKNKDRLTVEFLNEKPKEQLTAKEIKYKKSKLNEESAREIFGQMENAMKQYLLYQNPDLSLQSFSDETGIAKHLISQVLSTKMNTNFLNWVNDYRLETVLSEFNKKEHENFSIAGLAYKAGFRSKSTFYRYFKLKYGVTPSEHLNISESENSVA